MITLDMVKDLLEASSYVTVIVSLPLALHQYKKITKKEQLDREYGTYNALDEKYMEFLQLCHDNPRLDIFDIPDETRRELDSEEEKKELIAFTMLFSIFERAYLMYHDQSGDVRKRQWSGWNEYIHAYCRRENFRAAWKVSGETFDLGYQNFMAEELAQYENAVTVPVGKVVPYSLLSDGSR